MAIDQPCVFLAGAAHGIGRAMCEGLSRRGARVVALDIDRGALDGLASDVARAGGRIETVVGDVTKREDIAAALARAERVFGPADAAISNAGGMISLVAAGKLDRQFVPFHETEPATWRTIVDLNLIGAMNVAHAALPAMIARGRGRIVFISSVGGLVGSPGLTAYAASKGGVIALTKSLAREYARAGVVVNSVAPGGVATRAFSNADAAGARAERIPMGRLGAPEEIADVAIYLATESPPYLTGEVISVSGGPPA